jgi:hypothetical protein
VARAEIPSSLCSAQHPLTGSSSTPAVSRQASSMASEQGDFYEPIRTAAPGVFKYFCNNQWAVSASGKTVPVINPSTQAHDFAVQGEAFRRAGELQPSSESISEALPAAQRPVMAPAGLQSLQLHHWSPFAPTHAC